MKLYDLADSAETRAIIDAVVAVRSRRVVGRIGRAAGGFCRGLEVTVELDESGFFRKRRAYLFACVTKRFFALCPSINSFSMMVAHMQAARWPGRTLEMAVEVGHADRPLNADLFAEPYRFDFFQAVRLLERVARGELGPPPVSPSVAPSARIRLRIAERRSVPLSLASFDVSGRCDPHADHMLPRRFSVTESAAAQSPPDLICSWACSALDAHLPLTLHVAARRAAAIPRNKDYRIAGLSRSIQPPQ